MTAIALLTSMCPLHSDLYESFSKGLGSLNPLLPGCSPLPLESFLLPLHKLPLPAERGVARPDHLHPLHQALRIGFCYGSADPAADLAGDILCKLGFSFQ